MRQKIYLIGLYLWAVMTVHAQQTKSIAVEEDMPYEETLTFPFDEKGVELKVGIAFDEHTNELQLKVTGSRPLFVFQEDAYRNRVFTGFFSRKHLRPERLPYLVLVPPRANFYLTKKVIKRFAKPRGKHLFNRWVEGVSASLTPLPPSGEGQSGKYALPSDTLIMRFAVVEGATEAAFTLRNLYVLAETGKPQKPKYRFVWDQDLATTYAITLRRDPCLGLQTAVDSMKVRVEAIQQAYGRLLKTAPSGLAESSEEVGVFNQHKQYLLSQFLPVVDSTDCGDLQQLYSEYNHQRELIDQAVCVYVASNENGAKRLGMSPEVLLAAARRLDNLVALSEVTKDTVERRDLIMQGREILSAMNATIEEKGVRGEEQQAALAIFRRASDYFRVTVLKQ